MKFIFYQNTLSIHQSTLIKELAKKYDVTLVVENNEISSDRAKMGWSIPKFGNANIIVNPQHSIIEELLLEEQNIHIFTGITGFPFVYEKFKLAVKYKAYIGVQMESFENKSFRGVLRLIKYNFLSKKYKKSIKFILAMGDLGVETYLKSGFPEDKIYEWGYFTESLKDNNLLVRSANNKPKILFVGQLNSRKNILPLIKKLKSYTSLFQIMKIIGVGPLEHQILSLIDNTKFEYCGQVPNSEMQSYLKDADLLIIPSLFDGWGAVVNEALTVGTPVLCSKNCGASSLVMDNRGAKFENLNSDFDVVFKNLIENLPNSDKTRLKIIEWASNVISGRCAVEYLENILNYTNGNLTEKPLAPWKIK